MSPAHSFTRGANVVQNEVKSAEYVAFKDLLLIKIVPTIDITYPTSGLGGGHAAWPLISECVFTSFGAKKAPILETTWNSSLLTCLQWECQRWTEIECGFSGFDDNFPLV